MDIQWLTSRGPISHDKRNRIQLDRQDTCHRTHADTLHGLMMIKKKKIMKKKFDDICRNKFIIAVAVAAAAAFNEPHHLHDVVFKLITPKISFMYEMAF